MARQPRDHGPAKKRQANPLLFYRNTDALSWPGPVCWAWGWTSPNGAAVEDARKLSRNSDQNLSSATTAEEAARIIGDVADELFGFGIPARLICIPDGRVYPILNMDIIDGERCNIPQGDILTEPSERARKIMREGPQLFLMDEAQIIPPGANAFGDQSRPSASIMMAPIRNRTSAIGILCFASYTRKAYDQQDLQTLNTLADHCGGALERIGWNRN